MVIYAYIAKSIILGYSSEAYDKGINDVLNLLIIQIQQQGFAQIPVGNQTIILIPYQPQVQE